MTSVLVVIFFIKKNNYATKKKYKQLPLSISVAIATPITFVVRRVLSQVEYNLAILIGIILMSIVAYGGACMMHLYICFYYMRRYKIK
jgi:hypothetical protein